MDLRRRLQYRLWRDRRVADTYWADFLFGLTSSYQLANYFVVHLRQTLESLYAQDDWKVSPKLTVNLGAALGVRLTLLRAEQLYLQLRSGHADGVDTLSGRSGRQRHYAGHRQRRLRQDAGQSRPDRLFAARRIRLCAYPEDGCARRLRHRLCALHPRRFGRHFGHQRPAGPVCGGESEQPEADGPQPVRHSFAGADHRGRHHDAILLRHCRPGLPVRPGDHLQLRHRQHYLDSQKQQGRLRRKLLPERAEAVGQEHSARHRLRGQPRPAPGRLFERQPEESVEWLCAALRQLAERHYRSAE